MIKTIRQKVRVLLFLFFVVFLSFFVYLRFTSSAFSPADIHVSNATGSSLAISWITEKPTKGKIIYSDKSFLMMPVLNFLTAKTALDENSHSTTVHHVRLKDMKPDTIYHYKIINNFRQSNKSIVVTGPVLENISLPDPIFGQVLTKSGKVAENVLVYLKIKNQSESASFRL